MDIGTIMDIGKRKKCTNKPKHFVKVMKMLNTNKCLTPDFTTKCVYTHLKVSLQSFSCAMEGPCFIYLDKQGENRRRTGKQTEQNRS